MQSAERSRAVRNAVRRRTRWARLVPEERPNKLARSYTPKAWGEGEKYENNNKIWA